MSKKTIALITGLILLTILLVFLAMQTSKTPVKPPVEDKKPEIVPEAKTTLYFEPASTALTGNTTSVTVMLDSQDNEITAVQLELSYDPKALSFVSISPSPLFEKGVPLLNTVDKKNGRISYALGLSPDQIKTPHTGKIEVATVVFTKMGTASGSATQVTFLPKSLVSARGVNQSVLKETQGVTIQLSK